MARRGGSWRHGVVLWAGMLAVLTVITVIALALRGGDGLQTAGNVAQIASAVLAIPTLAVPLWLWSRRSTAPTAVTTHGVAKAKDVLAGMVDQQWRTEAMLRSLDDPDPIPVRWRITHREVMDHPANLTPASLLLTASSGDVTTLAGEFRAMRRRRLVILGGPGTGKTTLAVQLIRELLATRVDQQDEPIPVLVSVTGWDTHVFPRLHDWLVTRLAQDYPALRATDLGSAAPTVLVARGQILPVLDGLDELPPPAQAAVIIALNRSLSDIDQLIVTSRTTDYGRAVEAAGDVLRSAVVLEPESLDPAAAARYLHRCLPPRPGPVWEQILTHLRTVPAPPEGSAAVLADIAASALGLWLLRTVYITPTADPAALLAPGRFPDAAALRAHLFDQLITALIDTRPPSEEPTDLFRPHRRHDPAQMRRWLGYLAHHLTHLPAGDGTIGTRDFTWWHLAHTTRTLTGATRLAIAVTIALMIGLFGGVATALSDGLADGLGPGSAYGLGLGLTAGLVVGLAARSWSREPPGFTDLRVRGRG
ncbi:MAG TPA: NACHT domain-containing protein, partial [Pseudonocardiaceae bacterium]